MNMPMPAPAENLPASDTGSGSVVADAVQLSGPQKAAIVIALLGPEGAAPIVEKIGDKHLKVFISAFENMKMIPRGTLLVAVQDFIANLEITSASLKCGQKEARQLAEDLLDEQRIEKLFGSAQIIEEQAEDTSGIWGTLAGSKTTDIAAYLEKQRPQVIAIILNQLSTDKAGEVLAELSDEISPRVVSYLTKPGKIDPMTLATIGRVIDAEFLSSKADDSRDNNPLRSVSEIFSVLPTAKREALMDFLVERDEGIAEQVKKGIVTFEDLPDRLPRNAVPTVFREIDQAMLLKALKHGMEAMPGTVEYLFSNISQRMADQYKEQVEDLAPITTKEGEVAQSAFMSIVSRLDKEGAISLIKIQETTEE